MLSEHLVSANSIFHNARRSASCYASCVNGVLGKKVAEIATVRTGGIISGKWWQLGTNVVCDGWIRFKNSAFGWAHSADGSVPVSSNKNVVYFAVADHQTAWRRYVVLWPSRNVTRHFIWTAQTTQLSKNTVNAIVIIVIVDHDNNPNWVDKISTHPPFDNNDVSSGHTSTQRGLDTDI